jgi:hypothetical protein
MSDGRARQPAARLVAAPADARAIVISVIAT